MSAPNYDLSEVQRLVRQGHYLITLSAQRGAAHLGITPSGMVDLVEHLTATDFDKTMPATKAPGLWQEVYRPTYCGLPLYVKLQISEEKAVMVAFKQGR